MGKLKCRMCYADVKPHWIRCPKCKSKKPVTLECSCGEPLEDDWY